ncbi:hypothetical protein Ahy_B05g078996 [Arachis hypogaea]|uniref:Aminotransferase-like plant mobile domain-containing protein n=1 Tax=Arachis hypogaea TaxID=3818 RepID=A0A444Z8W8_ARAHY|nr:hypothetical protein Ahy_B05g078996 [Arachis hypogaea]
MATSSSHAAAQDKGKGPAVEPLAPPALHVLNQVNDDPQIQINDNRILILFTVGGDVHCFHGPVKTLERANKKLPFFPSAQGEDLLINQALDISFFINQKPFRNNPKINPRGLVPALAPLKSAAWGALGIQDLLRLSHFSPSILPWMIGAVTCFWNRTTNNFHLSCGMIGMSLLDVAVITGLPISPPDFTSDMQPRHQYTIASTTSYSEFIAHHIAKQLGFSQAIPTPLPRNNKPFCHITLTSQSELDFCLLKNQQQREHFNFLVYVRSSYITKSCFEWWIAYYSRYSRTLEEIQQSAIRTAPAAEGSPKKLKKEKLTPQPPYDNHNTIIEELPPELPEG